ncbi:MAG: ATP-binding cassette domain-containing protein, partial [Coprobacillaceae bacterium]
PSVLLCDEATSALDPGTTESILALLKEINEKYGITIVIITHEMSVVEDICTHVSVIEEGNVTESGTVKDIFTHPKSKWTNETLGPEKESLDNRRGDFIRIVFDGTTTYETIISNMVIETGFKVSIVYADVKEIDNHALGHLVIGLPYYESDKEKVLRNAEGNVEFNNVSFGYAKDKKVIRNFSATANAGEKLAIVGPTGAGKTTLVNLLMKFYEVDEGDILIDGISINNLTRGNVHDQFCMVLQDTWLFEGTIKENIVYSKEGVSDEDVIKACKAVGLHHYIMSLPNAYDTILDDKAGLSTGQKQLVTIARAMIDNAPMLILDEATSSIDTRTEKQIQDAMDKLTVGRTSFVIAHRLSTIKNADLILVVNEGNIVETGNHEELLQQNGFYADLYNSQFDVS